MTDACATAEESIYETLVRLGLSRNETRRVFSQRTRDADNLTVYRDDVSGVIFIDWHYVGDDTYASGQYRASGPSQHRGLEEVMNNQRRIERYAQFIVDSDICDFGCGEGRLLRLAANIAKSVVGVELQKDFADALNAGGILCVDDIAQVAHQLDAVFLFHSLEHFPNPSLVLRKVKQSLKPDGRGRIVVEVPHARDFLIQDLSCPEFVNFTLWSQHLILHTRESLRAFLHDAGFKSVIIEGVQRYGLSNHLHWLRNKLPGGHKGNLSVLDTVPLTAAYADALSRLDANDTLVAVATT